MGSFDLLCSITGMTLRSGDPMVRMLIVPAHLRDRWDSRNHFKEKAPLVSNEMGLAMFIPFGFPIRGEYYDYGQITNIVEDKNTKSLEEYFGVSIEELCNTLAMDDRWLTLGIERRDEALLKQKNGETLTRDEEYNISGAKSWWDGPNPNHIETLRHLTASDIRAEVYDLMIQSPKFHSDWQRKNYEELCSGYFEALDAKAKLEAEIDSLPEDRKYIQKLRLDMFHEHDTFLPHLTASEFNFLTCLKITRDNSKEYIEMLNFVYSLNSYRKLLLPTLYGTQETNYADLLELTKLTQSILKKNIKTLKDLYGE